MSKWLDYFSVDPSYFHRIAWEVSRMVETPTDETVKEYSCKRQFMDFAFEEQQIVRW